MLVPKLRFKEFNDEWNKIKLINIVTELNEKTKDTSNYPLWSLTLEDGVTPKTERYERGFLVKKEDNFKIVHYNNFVYNPMNLRLGAIAYHKEKIDISVSGYYNIFKIKNNFTIGFWDNYFKCPMMIKRYNNIATGSLVEKKRVHYSQFIELSVPVPSEEEQIKISNLLVLLNKKIELQQRKIEVLKMYKRGLMQKIFGNTEINSWSTNILRNILIPGSKVPVTDTSKYQKITIKLNLQGITKSNVNREMADTRPFYIRRENEIIIGKQNYFNGSIAILPKEFDGCICSNAIMSFSVNSNYLTKFVYYYISQNNYIKRREYFANGTGQKELSENDFLNFQIKVPSIDEQKHITNILDNIDSKINLNVNIYNSLTKLKKSLLQQMFI